MSVQYNMYCTFLVFSLCCQPLACFLESSPHPKTFASILLSLHLYCPDLPCIESSHITLHMLGRLLLEVCSNSSRIARLVVILYMPLDNAKRKVPQSAAAQFRSTCGLYHVERITSVLDTNPTQICFKKHGSGLRHSDVYRQSLEQSLAGLQFVGELDDSKLCDKHRMLCFLWLQFVEELDDSKLCDRDWEKCLSGLQFVEELDDSKLCDKHRMLCFLWVAVR